MYTGWCCIFFFFNDTATTEIYPLSLHDALPIFHVVEKSFLRVPNMESYSSAVRPRASLTCRMPAPSCGFRVDRKSTRLNSSHVRISYAGFCLHKKRIHHGSALLNRVANPFPDVH